MFVRNSGNVETIRLPIFCSMNLDQTIPKEEEEVKNASEMVDLEEDTLIPRNVLHHTFASYLRT